MGRFELGPARTFVPFGDPDNIGEHFLVVTEQAQYPAPVRLVI